MNVADFNLPDKCRTFPYLRKQQTKCIDTVDIKKKYRGLVEIIDTFISINDCFNLVYLNSHVGNIKGKKCILICTPKLMNSFSRDYIYLFFIFS